MITRAAPDGMNSPCPVAAGLARGAVCQSMNSSQAYRITCRSEFIGETVFQAVHLLRLSHLRE
jgi:hypothetical protein